jgi:hypothetical protein
MVVSVKFLVGLIATLALVLVLEWVVPAPGDTGGQPALPHKLGGGAKVAIPSREAELWARQILARPLFSISRRPAREATGTQSESVDQARLAGIMIGRFGRRAIFAPQGGGKPLVLAVGASVNESTIRDIFPDHVVLASGAVVRPSFDPSRPAGVTAPPFQPLAPAFPTPGFPNNGFTPPGFPVPQPTQPVPVPAEGDASQTPQPSPPIVPGPPLFRGQMLPPRRE